MIKKNLKLGIDKQENVTDDVTKCWDAILVLIWSSLSSLLLKVESSSTSSQKYYLNLFIAGILLTHPLVLEKFIDWESLRAVFCEKVFDQRSELRLCDVAFVFMLVAVFVPKIICVLLLKQ